MAKCCQNMSWMQKNVLMDLLGECPDFTYKVCNAENCGRPISPPWSQDWTANHTKVPLWVSRGVHWVQLGLLQKKTSVGREEGERPPWNLCEKEFEDGHCWAYSIFLCQSLPLYAYLLASGLFGVPWRSRSIIPWNRTICDQKMKVHHNTANQESAFIAQDWWESQKSSEKIDISK